MGGKGSGGLRVGAGRKRKSQSLGDLTGSRRTRARSRQQFTVNQSAGNQIGPTPTAATASTLDPAIPEPPGNLTLEELAEWNELAPRAFKEGTLTDETKLALRDLCQARVLKDKLLRQIGDVGNVVLGTNGTLTANPLLSRFTTLLQRVDAGMLRFKLSPMGKPIDAPAEKPADPFAEFDADARQASESVN